MTNRSTGVRVQASLDTAGGGVRVGVTYDQCSCTVSVPLAPEGAGHTAP